MEKFVVFMIVGIVVISAFATFVAVGDPSVTGQAYGAWMAYGTGGKLYGPGLKRAQQRADRLASVNEHDLFVQRMQGKVVANKDKLVCGPSSDGPDPCLWFEDKQQWCCLPGGNNQDVLAPVYRLPRDKYVYGAATSSGLPLR
ncbi:hypothetical protein HY489_06295 [Candidatus Woesearchaeota archaeon]|nr:hypothetical protein [Candidatus Woesearchaeota archaeon]